MTPNKKIYNHSFLGGLGKLKFFDEDGNLLCHKTQTYIDAEAELTRILTEEIAQEIDREVIQRIRANTLAQDLVAVQPMGAPIGRLMYLDYNYGPIEEPVVYKDGSWSFGNLFEGVIGINSEIKSHTFI